MSDRLIQDDHFASGEGDQWFERNRDALGKGHDDWPLKLIRRNGLSPASVLEIGCANGWRLAAIASTGAQRVVGVDISSAAVESGVAQYPGLDLRVGRASTLPINSEEFELVIVNYVFHWIDRSTILSAISEADRCVADGGHLIIGDFLPDRPTRVPYHHLKGQGVFTYKLDYAAVFAALGTYKIIDREVYNHDDPSAEPTSRNRGAVTLLRKSLTSLYELGPAT